MLGTIVTFLVVIDVLILVHELGHFLAAKAVGIRVEEFAVGVGPRLIRWERGGTAYILRLIPILGYNKFGGELADDRPARSDDFRQKPVWARAVVAAAGPAMNFVLAAVLFLVIYAGVGIQQPLLTPPVIGQVVAGMPAARAHLQNGDRVLAINGQTVRNWTQLVRHIEGQAGRPLVLSIQRSGGRRQVTLTPQRSRLAGGKGVIGVYPQVQTVRYPLGRSIAMGIGRTGQMSALLLQALGQAVSHHQSLNFAGPVGIGEAIGQAAQAGWGQLLTLAAFISINLGIVNLLPLPALDGGHLVFLAVEGIRGRPLEQEGIIHMVGMAVLLLFMLILTYRDILRLHIG